MKVSLILNLILIIVIGKLLIDARPGVKRGNEGSSPSLLSFLTQKEFTLKKRYISKYQDVAKLFELDLDRKHPKVRAFRRYCSYKSRKIGCSYQKKNNPRLWR